MRYGKIFFIHLQNTFEQRSVMFVYFLMSLINPLIFVLFWQGATSGGRSIIPGWDFSAIVSYYFYFTILNGLLMAHPEYDVSRLHIKEGNLVMFLLKPVSYFLQIFFLEFSWRFLRFFFGFMTILLFYTFWRGYIIPVHNSLLGWILVCVVLFLGFMVSFTIKMVMGVTAFWLTDTTGFYDFMEVIFMVFGGFILPLGLLPPPINVFSISLPFAYVLYFPVIVLEGKIPVDGIVHVIVMQLLWIVISFSLYELLWRKGIQKFTAVGQ